MYRRSQLIASLFLLLTALLLGTVAYLFRIDQMSFWVVAVPPTQKAADKLTLARIKYEAKINGTFSPTVFEENLQKSLKLQPVPDLWFEYRQEDGYIRRTYLPDSAKELLLYRWENTLQLLYDETHANDENLKTDLRDRDVNDLLNAGSKLRQIIIQTPYETREISAYETEALFEQIKEAAATRFWELQQQYKAVTATATPDPFKGAKRYSF